MYLKILVREKYSLREKGTLGSKHAVNVSKGTWHRIKIREREGGFIQTCEPHERSPCAPKFGEISHEEALHQERCARRVAWDLAKSTYKLKNSDKATFLPEEREFVVASGASMHVMSKKRIKQRRDGYFAKIPEHHCGAYIQWRGEYKRGCTKLFDEWVSSQKPRVTKEEKTIICKTDNFAFLVVPGLSTRSGSNSSSTSTCQQVQPKSEVTIGQQETVAIQVTSKKNTKKEGQQSSIGKSIAGPSGMVRGVHRKSGRFRSACTRTRFSGLRFGTSYKSGNEIKEAQYSYSLPEGPNLRSLQANQNHKGSLQKTHWRNSTSGRKVW